MDEALQAAGLPLLRFAARRAYTVQEVQAELENLGPQGTGTRGGARPRDAPPAARPSPCTPPDAGNTLASRFWGCPNYPKCRTMVPVAPSSPPAAAAAGNG